jgi:hypothetical protein
MGLTVYNGTMTSRFNIRDENGRFVYRHGLSGKYIYRIWTHMMGRCYNPNNHAYNRYGGRGIKVYKDWHDVESFNQSILKTIGNRPTGSHSLDRIDNGGDYEPNNVKWSSAKEQANNRRVPRTNTSGHENISFRKDSNRWRVRCIVGDKRITVGNFDSLDDALDAKHRFLLEGVQ